MFYFLHNAREFRNKFCKIICVTALAIAAATGMNFIFFSVHAAAFDAGSVKPEKYSGNHIGRVIKIDVHTLLNLLQMDPNLYIVDVRKTEKFNAPSGHIESAVHIAFNYVLKHPDHLPHGKTLVFVSETGSKGRTAAEFMADKGYVAYYLTGGIKAWNKLLKHNIEPESEPENNQDIETETPVEQDLGC